MILGFHHAAISSPDIERLIGFYTEKLGATVLRRGGWDNPIEAVDKRLGLEASTCRIAILRVGLTYLELFEFDGAEARGPKRTASDLGIAHLCFQVDDCWEEYRRLSALGVEFHDEPLTMPTGATFTYARDPDDNIIELLSIPEDADFPRLDAESVKRAQAHLHE